MRSRSSFSVTLVVVAMAGTASATRGQTTLVANLVVGDGGECVVRSSVVTGQRRWSKKTGPV